MARTKKKPAEDITFNPAEFDTPQSEPAANPATPIVQELTEHTRLPEATEREAAHEGGHSTRQFATGFIANPSSKRRESHAAVGRKLPGTLGITAGDLVVRLIDKGDNMAGIGIRVEVPEGRELSEEEKAIIRLHVKGTEDKPSGFTWQGKLGMWHKHIAREGERLDDIPPTRAVAIRLDAESRVERLAESLRHHQADPVGFADRIRQQREQAAQSERIPD